MIESIRLSRSVFRAARSGPAFAVATGTRLRLALSEASRLTFRIQRARRGRRVHGRCVRPTAKNRTRPRCTRWVYLRGRVRRSAHAGTNRFRFRGRWRRHRLRPGRYRFVVVAVDAAGNRSHKRRVRFRIVR